MEEQKQLTNLQIAELLRDVAASYELQDDKANKFKIVAYERAADAVEHSTSELKDLWDDGKLEEVPGIGPSIAKHLDQLFSTGRSIHFDSLMKGIPKEAFKLMELPGIGIKTAMKMIKEGDKTEIQKKLKEVEVKEKKGKRYLLPYAQEIAKEIIDYLLKSKDVKRADPLGSLRRSASTIGDIDILAMSKLKNQNSKVIDYFTKYPKTQKIIEAGDRTASILLPSDVRVDVMVMEEEAYGSALQHFTGSKHHNIALRDFALKKGLSLSEYGIKDIKSHASKLNKFRTEEEFYKFLGLSYIEPELREDAGEIEAALRQDQGLRPGLPESVQLSDVKADLQIHSDFDIETSHDNGESTMDNIIKKGTELGYEYLAFTEHNPSQSGHSGADMVEILKRKREKVEQINYSLTNNKNNGVRKVYNSLEIDILSDGLLPIPDSTFDLLDFALVSIHSSFRMDRKSMTQRIISALSHPKSLIFAHPTARKINEREGVEIDWPKIFDYCLKNSKWIEINADPMRLDLPDTLVREAVKLGVKLTLGTDAHHINQMDNMQYGVSVARRGWCEKKNIINCLSLSDFEKEIL